MWNYPTAGRGIFGRWLTGILAIHISVSCPACGRKDYPTAGRGIFDPPGIGTLSLITSPILVPSVEAKQMDGGSLLFGNDL